MALKKSTRDGNILAKLLSSRRQLLHDRLPGLRVDSGQPFTQPRGITTCIQQPNNRLEQRNHIAITTCRGLIADRNEIVAPLTAPLGGGTKYRQRIADNHF